MVWGAEARRLQTPRPDLVRRDGHAAPPSPTTLARYVLHFESGHYMIAGRPHRRRRARLPHPPPSPARPALRPRWLDDGQDHRIPNRRRQAAASPSVASSASPMNRAYERDPSPPCTATNSATKCLSIPNPGHLQSSRAARLMKTSSRPASHFAHIQRLSCRAGQPIYLKDTIATHHRPPTPWIPRLLHPSSRSNGQTSSTRSPGPSPPPPSAPPPSNATRRRRRHRHRRRRHRRRRRLHPPPPPSPPPPSPPPRRPPPVPPPPSPPPPSPPRRYGAYVSRG